MRQHFLTLFRRCCVQIKHPAGSIAAGPYPSRKFPTTLVLATMGKKDKKKVRRRPPSPPPAALLPRPPAARSKRVICRALPPTSPQCSTLAPALQRHLTPLRC